MKFAGRACVVTLGLCLAVSTLTKASDTSQIDHDDDYVYGLPYAADDSFAVIQSYGSRLSHTGSEFFTVDFSMPIGTPVHAAREGFVIAVENLQERGCWATGCGRYANHVAIRHADGTVGLYFHLNKNGVAVSVGDHVMRGQKIAVSGNTGYTTVPHLHFGVYVILEDRGGQSIDVRFLTSRGIMGKLRPGNRYRHPETPRTAAR